MNIPTTTGTPTRSGARILIIGGGHAGAVAALAARAADADARISVFGDEMHLPYERPALSKEMLSGEWDADRCARYPAAEYTSREIEMKLGRRVSGIDLQGKHITLDDGSEHGYDKLIIATGSRVRTLAGCGAESRLRYLRTLDDAIALRPRLTPGRKVIVIGAGFIGLEVAATARQLACDVIVVDLAPQVLARVFPAGAAQVVQRLHDARGVALRLGARIDRMDERGDRLFVSIDGEAVLCDEIVVGIGVLPNTELARQAGLAVEDGLIVDATGRTSDPDVYGAGEVTRHPTFPGSVPQRIESWQVAEVQAAVAGASAAGKPTQYEAVPWFWSDQFGVNIQCAGEIGGDGKHLIRGNADAAHLRVRLDERGVILGAAAFDNAKEMSFVRRLMQKGTPVKAELLADAAVPLKQVVAT